MHEESAERLSLPEAEAEHVPIPSDLVLFLPEDVVPPGHEHFVDLREPDLFLPLEMGLDNRDANQWYVEEQRAS